MNGTIFGYGQTVSYQFSDDGVYHVRLIVTDNEGAVNKTDYTPITVYNVPPVAQFNWVPSYPVPGYKIFKGLEKGRALFFLAAEG